MRLLHWHQHSIFPPSPPSGENLTPVAPFRTKGKEKGKPAKRQTDYEDEETATGRLDDENMESVMTQKDAIIVDNNDDEFDDNDNDKISNDDEETQLPDDFETKRSTPGVKCTTINACCRDTILYWL